MVGSLGEARELLTQLLVLVHIVTGKEDMSLSANITVGRGLFALGHVGTNIRLKILTNARDNFTS
jgi:hypothetical protein